MAMSHLRRACLGTSLFFLVSQGGAQKPPDLTAVLTRIEGQVTLSAQTRAEFRSVHHAAPRQVLRSGEIVHVPAGARLDLICSTDTLVSLQGPVEWTLGATACGQGRALPESSYRNLAPQAGRLLSKNGSLLLEFETRNWEGDLGPILLSPRNTAVLDPRPTLVWTRVPEAVEYEIELRGPVSLSIRVAAGDLRCGPDLSPWQGLDVCAWTPSDRWSSLEPDSPVFLRLGSRKAPAASLRQNREVSRIHLLPVNEQPALRERLRQIDTLSIDRGTRLLLSAGVYARSGLSSAAAATYDEALKAEEVPEARVTLADLHLANGLTILADREYRRVLENAPGPAVQAAAELGLGFAAYLRKRFDDARAHFERAQEIYATLGLPVEAEKARAAAARARSGNDSP